MDAGEALGILGLSPGATVEEIDRRYREVMLYEHPDQGGDAERAIQLNLARDVARKAAQQAQIARERAEAAAAKAAAEAAKAAERDARRKRAKAKHPLGKETQEILDRMAQVRIGPLRVAEYACALLCLLFAVIAVVASPAMARDARHVPHSYLWTILFGLAAFIFGCCTSIVSNEVRRARRRLAALSEILETPVCLRAVVEEMLGGLVNRAPIGRKKMEEDIQRAAKQAVRHLHYDSTRVAAGRLTQAQLAAIAFAVSPADAALRGLVPGLSLIAGAGGKDTCDFGRLFVARGLEGGFIQEQRIVLRGEMSSGLVLVVPAREAAPAGTSPPGPLPSR